MSEDPKVDYADVREDFEFFLAHSTETAAQIRAMVPHLEWLSGASQTQRFLDFGCGTGDFTAELLNTLDPSPDNLELFLVEPVEEHRQQAEKALAPFSTSLAESAPYLASLKAADFDLILANHSIYYLTAPEVLDLANRVTAGGMLIVALQSTQSALAKIWLESCKLSGETFPFLLSDDVERLFEENAISYEREMVPYRIEFPDTEENRYRVLHFLFGTYLDRIPRERALAFFDPHAHDGSIRIDTEYPHLYVRSR